MSDTPTETGKLLCPDKHIAEISLELDICTFMPKLMMEKNYFTGTAGQTSSAETTQSRYGKETNSCFTAKNENYHRIS